MLLKILVVLGALAIILYVFSKVTPPKKAPEETKVTDLEDLVKRAEENSTTRNEIRTVTEQTQEKVDKINEQLN